ncbi:MAG: hypothetical protein RBU25_14975, partial [Lentisphaeria bacterium]|nr:hypothetical protein [Lentisphaeria bacterium]
GDSFNSDHAVWGNPDFVGANGAKTSLTDQPPQAAKVGWFSIQVRKNERVAGTPFPLAWFAHAASYACFAVPEDTVRFEAFGGILDSACGGKVGFEVQAAIPADRAAEAFWNQLKKDFPEQSAWIEADLPDGGHLRWLAAGGAENRRLIDAALATLAGGGAQLRARADEYTAANLPPDDPKWLRLYLETRARAARVREVLAAADFARRTLDMVEKTAPRPAFHQELAALDTRLGTARQNPATDWAAELAACQALRRRIVFSHPALDFPDLLINKRPPPTFSHQCDQYLGRHSRPGPGLVVLHDWKSDKPRETPLLANQLPVGTTAHPTISYDAKRIAFSFCDHTVERKEWRRFLIHEIGVDGSGLRQLTGTPGDSLDGWQGRRTVLIEDFDPCYLPDGGIAFISTRCQTFGRCHHRRYNPSYLLHRMNADGTGIRQISFGEANEWDPSVLHDGRIIWTRWDYINRHDTFFQSLWTTRPDGTSTAHFYGNYTRNPCMTAEPRAIPGSHRVVSTAMAHHGYTAGSIIAIDPHRGQDGLEPVTRLTPDVPFPETEGWDIPRIYCSPWPLNEDLYFVAYSPKPLAIQGKYQEVNAFQICLIDRLGGREPVYVDPDMSCFDPIPLVPRPVPPVLPSMLPGNPAAETGTIYHENANLSHPSMPEGVRIHALRVNSIHGQPTPSVPHRGKVRQEIVKRIEGYAPVDGNGSASFRAPANLPLQLQALDENGMAVMTMRSFIYLQPGEYLSCVGCHEQRASSPPRAHRVAIPDVAELSPPAGPRYPGGFSFMKTVQPVLDRHCIACHGLAPEPAAKLNLLGSQATFPIDGYPGWPQNIRTTASYESLLHRPGLVRIAQRNEETASSKPDDYFARAGKLAKFLLAGHCPPLLEDRDGLRRIIDWLDLNAQYNGDYSWNRDEDRQPETGGEKALREFLARRFGPELAAQPFAALVNVGLPEQSRVLLAALPAEAGGWGQFPNTLPARNDQDYQQLESLVRQAIAPAAHQDREGTCAQTPCICGSCWVREAEAFWRQRTPALAARPE